MAIGGVMLFVMLAAFVITCRANNKSGREVEDDDVKERKVHNDSTEISEETNERGMKKGGRASKSD